MLTLGMIDPGTAVASVFVDNRFGFLSIAGIVTVPLDSITTHGAWNIHGGVEFQKLGDTTAFFNGGHHAQVIGSVGIGFSY